MKKKLANLNIEDDKIEEEYQALTFSCNQNRIKKRTTRKSEELFKETKRKRIG